MDALEFLKEHKRMCNEYKNCYRCPLANSHCIVNHLASDDDNKKIVDITEKWSKDHPRKTRQSVFLEQFPKAELDMSGVITICPTPLLEDYRNDHGGCKHPGIACSECRREFWMQEVE